MDRLKGNTETKGARAGGAIEEGKGMGRDPGGILPEISVWREGPGDTISTGLALTTSAPPWLGQAEQLSLLQWCCQNSVSHLCGISAGANRATAEYTQLYHSRAFGVERVKTEAP